MQHGRTSVTVLTAFLSFGVASAATRADSDNGRRLAEAARDGDRATVDSLVHGKFDPNVTLEDGSTALQWLVEDDNAEGVAAAIRAGADVKAANRYGVVPLMVACEVGSAGIVRMLLDAGADPNTANPRGETVLMTAARIGTRDVIGVLLDRGAKVNARESELQQTAVMWAIREQNVEAVKLLIARGADVNAATRVGPTPPKRPGGTGGGSHGVGIVRQGAQFPIPGGMTPLLYAAREGNLEILSSVVAAGAHLNQADASGATPLLVAIINNNLEAANFLLNKGVDVNAADEYGRTPLWATVELRNLEMESKTGSNGITDRKPSLELIEALLQKDASPNPRTKDVPPIRRWMLPLGDISWVNFSGQTPFVRAALSGDIEVMRLLLAHGADPNIPTVGGTTALMAAAGVDWSQGQTFTESKESLLEAVKLCWEKGADVNAKNSMGFTALHGAANRGSDEIIEFLASKGAKLDAKDNDGRTPMDFAEGVFLAAVSPHSKPSTIALLQKLAKLSTGEQASLSGEHAQ